MTEFLSKGFKILRAISLSLPKSGLMNAEPAKIYKKKKRARKKSASVKRRCVATSTFFRATRDWGASSPSAAKLTCCKRQDAAQLSQFRVSTPFFFLATTKSRCRYRRSVNFGLTQCASKSYNTAKLRYK